MATGDAGAAWRDAYEIVEEIGEGAVAKVYSAKHRDTGQLVAVKVMRREIARSAQDRERFRREAIAISEIRSPHVCTVYDFDTAGDEVYMVMEFVQGPTLRQVIKNMPWTVSDISNVIGQIGEALYAAHQRGIVHRDLKPENVVLAGTGLARQVKVLDFGFVKLLEAERSAEVEELTAIGDVFGTPQYMSPEQVTGKVVSPQSDLFALGVIAYELVVGQRPWSGATPHQVMLAVATKPPPKIEDARCDLLSRRNELEKFFARALHKAPAERFHDAHEFCRSLDAALGFDANPTVDDPQDWIEAVTQISLFEAPTAETDYFDEDTAVDPVEETLHATWHSIDTAAATLVEAAPSLPDQRPAAYANTLPARHRGPETQSDEETGGRLKFIALGVFLGLAAGVLVLLWLR